MLYNPAIRKPLQEGDTMTGIQNLSSMIGSTSLVELTKLADGLGARVFAKIESRNPGGSVKDRIARGMLDDAESRGVIVRGVSRIVEPTSGNTGIALAMLGAERGYQVTLTMPDSMSIERRKMLAAFGAELVLTPKAQGMAGAVAEAKRLVEEGENAWMPSQFENPANPASHFTTTGPEIAAALEGSPDYIVAGVGTGGTISGTGRYLRSLNPEVVVIAVEPTESAIIAQALAGEAITPGSHGIQGIGANFIPGTLDLEVLDEALNVATDDAIAMARRLASEEGLSAGISAGAAVVAALRVAARPEAAGKTVVTVLPDTGERYLSTPLWSHLEF